MRLWQPAHDACVRCCSSRSRCETPVAVLSRLDRSTSGGGAGTIWHSTSVRILRPRRTIEVLRRLVVREHHPLRQHARAPRGVDLLVRRPGGPREAVVPGERRVGEGVRRGEERVEGARRRRRGDRRRRRASRPGAAPAASGRGSGRPSRPARCRASCRCRATARSNRGGARPWDRPAGAALAPRSAPASPARLCRRPRTAPRPACSAGRCRRGGTRSRRAWAWRVARGRRTELEPVEELRRLQHREDDPLDARLEVVAAGDRLLVEALIAGRVVGGERPAVDLLAERIDEAGRAGGVLRAVRAGHEVAGAGGRLGDLLGGVEVLLRGERRHGEVVAAVAKAERLGL